MLEESNLQTNSDRNTNMPNKRSNWAHVNLYRNLNIYRAMRLLPYTIFKYLLRWHEEYRYEIFRQVYEIDPSFRFGGNNILLYGLGRIVLGANSYMGNLSTIASDEGCLVQIGRGCPISHNVRIYTQSYAADQDFSLTRNTTRSDVIIQDNVWIGANVFINPGVTIGQNSIVGANSIVTHDVEPGSIVGGVPAHLIRMKRLPRA